MSVLERSRLMKSNSSIRFRMRRADARRMFYFRLLIEREGEKNVVAG